MDKIYDLDGLMRKTGAWDYFALQDLNYDIIGYFENRQNEILMELAEIEICLEALKDDESDIDDDSEEDNADVNCSWGNDPTDHCYMGT